MTRQSLATPRALFAVVLALGVISIVSPRLAAQGASVTATEAWVREAPAGRKVTAVFLRLENRSATERHLVRGATEAADTLELHEMKREGGMMRMSPVPRITVPAHGEVMLRPGGLHLMLFGVRRPLVAGDTIRVSLTLDDGTRLEVPAEVRSMMGRMP